MNGTAPQMTVTLRSDGVVQLQANIDNTVALYGMLEMAKDAIRKSIDEKSKGPQIVAAGANALAGLQN